MDRSILNYRYSWPIRYIRKFLLKFGLSNKNPIINFYNYSFQLDLSQEGISKTIYTNRVREIDHCTVFKSLIQNKSKFLDLGANIGYYALFTFAHAREDTTIICVEPDPRNIKVLKSNIKINDLYHKAEIVDAAVSNNRGEVVFELAAASNLNKISVSKQRQKNELNKTSSYFKIDTITLDDIFNRYGAVESVRMDIEGAEALVFQEHSRKFLEAMPAGSSIFMEVHPGSYLPNTETMRTALQNIKNAGFNKYGFITSGTMPDPRIVEKLGPAKEVFVEDKFQRHHYADVNFFTWEAAALNEPKQVRYIYCLKDDL